MNERALKAMQSARTALLLDNPFWGTLALKLKLVEDPTCSTAWTDGVSIGYNPDFIEGLPVSKRIGTVAHEVGHVLLGHPWRRDGREARVWNQACDYVLNQILIDAGFELPDFVLLDAQYAGKSAEWVCDRIGPEPQPEPEAPEPESEEGEEGDEDDAGGTGGSGEDEGEEGEDESGGSEGEGSEEGEGDEDGDGAGGGSSAIEDGDEDGEDRGGGAGEPSTGDGAGRGDDDRSMDVRDAPANAVEEGCGEEDWKQAARQAAQAAKSRGDLPGSLARLVEEVTTPRADWRSLLRRFATEVAKADYSWTRPNTRHLAGGLYLPSLRSEEMGPLAVVFDTSGSIDDVLCGQFGAELNSIITDLCPRRVHVIYADAAVRRHDVFEQGDEVVLNPVGGGGTDFRPAIEAIEDLDDPVVCAVYLTDLMGRFPESEPDYPVLWAVVGDFWKRYHVDVPFGELAEIE